jgi:hypothetical protein
MTYSTKEKTIAIMHDIFTSASFTIVQPAAFESGEFAPGWKRDDDSKKVFIEIKPADEVFSKLRPMINRQTTLKKQNFYVCWNLWDDYGNLAYQYNSEEGTPDYLFPVDYPLPLENLSREAGDSKVNIVFTVNSDSNNHTLIFKVGEKEASEKEYNALYLDMQAIASAIEEIKLHKIVNATAHKLDKFNKKIKPNILKTDRESPLEKEVTVEELLEAGAKELEKALKAEEATEKSLATLEQHQTTHSTRARTSGGAAAPAAGAYTPADGWTGKVYDEERHHTPAR